MDRRAAHESFFGKAHLPAQAHEFSDLPRVFIGIECDLDLERVTKAFGIAAQHRALLVKVSGDLDPLIADVQFFLDRNLRYMGDQSKRHAGYEIG